MIQKIVILIGFSSLFMCCSGINYNKNRVLEINPFDITFNIKENMDSSYFCFEDTINILVNFYNKTDTAHMLSMTISSILHTFEEGIFVYKELPFFVSLTPLPANIIINPKESYYCYYQVFLQEDFFYEGRNKLVVLTHFDKYQAKSSNSQEIYVRKCN